ncbi:MAG: methylenetetrahydrofolate reductase C-terminal domain-containing protein, partial [Lentisphaeria bacterium]|nr:methylenetetrahydrofolate reductase C-terminal domain-containing protein [Lentisphaeria bacterium]
VMTKASLPLPTGMDRVKARVLSWLLSEETPAHIVKAAQVLLERNDVKDPHLLRHCYYLNHSQCPKALAYGPCGGSATDGTCEFGHAPCFFQRVIALAADRQELDLLEEGIEE